jgi:hypothetical protein
MKQLLCGKLAAAIAVLGSALVVGISACEGLGPGVSEAADRQVFYVSVAGLPTNNGTRARPLDLATVLGKNSPAKPGSTIWLAGGTYRGPFASVLTGAASAPIVVRGVHGERVTIVGPPSRVPALHVRGAWTTYRDFEVTNNDPGRLSSQTGTAHDIRRGIGVDVEGPNTKFINLVIHDAAGGMGIWANAVNAEAYGNLIYYNGWKGSDRSHGHGIYTQNRTGIRRLTDNIIFSQFGHGIHAYGSGTAFLDHIHLDGNISFNNGALDPVMYDRNLLIGGGRMAQQPVVTNNYTYYAYAPGRGGGDNNLGLDAGCRGLKATGNYWAHLPTYPLTLHHCDGILTGNVMVGPVDDRIINTYPKNVYLRAKPKGVRVFVRPNKYDRRRAHIVVYNWDHRPDVQVDVSATGLRRGDRYEVRDVQDYFGHPVKSGVFDGRMITISMQPGDVARPVGLTQQQTPSHTAPEFGAYVLLGK